MKTEDRPLSSEDIPGYLCDNFLSFIKHHKLEAGDDFLDDPYAYQDMQRELSEIAHEWVVEICRSKKYYGEQN